MQRFFVWQLRQQTSFQLDRYHLKGNPESSSRDSFYVFFMYVSQHGFICCPSVAGVLDEPFSQLIRLSGVAVQARQSIEAGTFVAWRAGMPLLISGHNVGYIKTLQLYIF
jgi:hypothetical protein